MAAIRQVMCEQDSNLNEMSADSIEEFKLNLIINTELLEIIHRVLGCDHADNEEIYFI